MHIPIPKKRDHVRHSENEVVAGGVTLRGGTKYRNSLK